MELKELQENWDELGNKDPLWAIVSWDEKRGGKWDLCEFFETGEQEIREVLQTVDSLHFPLRRGRALDFGCGVGRLTQALGEHFAECCGVDIARSMIELAQRYNRHGERCNYVLNEVDNLRVFPNNHFDFIYSSIVLQHMRPEYSAKYIQEFVRLLAPGGLGVFQLPCLDHRTQAMPASGFRARISLNQERLRMQGGTSVTLWVTVTNVSDTVWPALALGNHWLDRGGNMLVQDDGRTWLPDSVQPGEEVLTHLVVRAPQHSGFYLLELDVVQEHMAWFKDKGGAATVVPVDVDGMPRPSKLFQRLFGRRSVRCAPVGERSEPVMEMYHVPQAQVLGLLTVGGANIVESRPMMFRGGGLHNYAYFFTK